MITALSYIPESVVPAIRALHDKPHKLVCYVTGAGSGLQGLLAHVGGSSRTVLDAGFPYHPLARVDIVGEGKAVTRDTAVMLAGAAYARALELAQRDGLTDPLIGLGLTAAIGTDRVRKGADEAYIAVKTENDIRVLHLVFEKGQERHRQDAVCIHAALNLVLEATGLRPVPIHANLESYGPLLDLPSPHPIWGPPGLLAAGNDGRLILSNGSITTRADLDPEKHILGKFKDDEMKKLILFPGSFRLTFGHLQLADLLEKTTKKQAVFAITTDHPVKGKVPQDELETRIRALLGIAPILLSEGDGLFIEKARRAEGFHFLIGADVGLGILDDKYYGGYGGLMDALSEFIKLGTVFHVVGRVVDGYYMTAYDLPIPRVYEDLFVPVSGRWDISSTEIAARSK